MVRIALVLAIWIVFAGGFGLYMHKSGTAPEVAHGRAQLQAARGSYTIEITPTFSASPDPFVLQDTKGKTAAVLLLRIGEREILRLTDNVEVGKPVRLEGVEGLVDGTNELFLEVNPPVEESDRRHFVQVRVLRDNAAIAEQVFWSEGGARVTGGLRFKIIAEDEKRHDN